MTKSNVIAFDQKRLRALADLFAKGGMTARLGMTMPPEPETGLQTQRWFFGSKEDLDWLSGHVGTLQAQIIEMSESLKEMLEENDMLMAALKRDQQLSVESDELEQDGAE